MAIIKETSTKFIVDKANITKKATNLTLSIDVIEDAKLLGINISKACDEFLRDFIREEKTRKWQLEHADYFARSNQIVEERGLPLDEWRSF
jgi:antitoxin CcdA